MLSRDSHIINVLMKPKFGNSSTDVSREVLVTVNRYGILNSYPKLTKN